MITLPFKQPGQRSWQKPFDYTLPEQLVVEQWIVPAGITVMLLTGNNFGYVVLPPGCKDCRGFEISRRVFRF